MQSQRRSRALIALALLVTLTASPGVAATSHDESDGSASAVAAAAARGDLADLAFSLEFDIERIFRFVADEIRYEPYTGILRGARGTLDSGAGNSVDQALLLAALLDESLVPYRFARGPLDEAIATELIDSITTDAADARLIVEAALARGWDELVGGFATAPRPPSGPLFDLYELGLGATVAEAEERLGLAESRLRETAAMIGSALDGAGIDLPTEAVSLPSAELVDHTWVQVASGADWLDLDPTLSALEAGSTLAPATETLDRLPDDLRHRVEFEVLVERVSRGQLLTDAVLEYSAFADQIAGVPVTFGHITPTGAERFGLALRAVLGAGKTDYRPFLDIGGRSLVSDEAVVFDLAGSEGGGGLLEGTDLFSDTASSTDPAGPAEGETTAEWLEVRVTQPGSEPAVARRTVFDRLPAHARYGGQATVDAVEPIELVDLDGTGSSEFLPMLGLESFVIATGTTNAAAIVAPLFDASPQGLGMYALTYHGLRDALGAEIAIDEGARMFVDGPNIVSFSLDADGVGLDIWHRNLGNLPLIGSTATVAGAGVVAGITGHIAEQVALEGLARAQGPDLRAIGVNAVFEAAARDKIPTLVLRGAVPDALPYDAMAIALIEQAVGAGDVVVIPAEPVIFDGRERVGWWRIDPATGVTMDAMDDGSGSTEYPITVSNAVRWTACVSAYSLALFDVIGALMLALGSSQDSDMIGFMAASTSAAFAGMAAAVVCHTSAPARPRFPSPPGWRPPSPPYPPFPRMPPGWRPPGAMPAPPLPRGPLGTFPNIPHWGVF